MKAWYSSSVVFGERVTDCNKGQELKVLLQILVTLVFDKSTSRSWPHW